MSQHDLDIANQGFPATRADLNNALKALGSLQSGATAPSTTYANMLWYDTANNILKIRNEDNDAFISLFTLDQTNDNIEALTVDGTITADALTVDTNTLHVDASENKVGIGTVTPDTYSDYVAGSLTTGLAIAGSFPGIQLADTDVSGSNSTFGISKSGQDTVINNLGTSGTIKFYNAGGQRANITADGLTFGSDTAAANALDDYEEGTFTPQLLGGTSNPSSTVSGSGEYIKVGKLVFIYIKFSNVNTTGASGYIRITGQPFNPSQTNGPLSMSAYDFDFNGRTSLTAEINNGEINGITSGDDTGWGLLNFGAGTARYIFIAGTYRIA